MAAQNACGTVLTGFLMLVISVSNVAALKDVVQKRGANVSMNRNRACDGSALTASVVRPGDAAYDTSRSQFASSTGSSSTSDERTKPQMIIFCSTDAHVQEAVSFATTCGFKISVRSGGHSYAAMSSCTEDSPNCIQVDLSGIDTFVVDTTMTPKRVTMGAGLMISQVYTQLLPYGIHVPGGICNQVGVGGHYQTSAAGFFTRTLGLGIDAVKSFRIVLADATVQVVDESSDPDLYWAVLGGGPGSWGILLDYTAEAFEDADYPHVKSFIFLYPYSRAAWMAIGGLYSSLMAQQAFERDYTVSVTVNPDFFYAAYGVPQGGGAPTHYIQVRGTWTGVDNGELTSALHDQLVKPFADIPHATLVPVSPFTLSAYAYAFAYETSLLGSWRSHVNMIALKTLPTTEFLQLTADELDVRVAIPNYRTSFQSWSWDGQFARNAGKNAYASREARHWIDDWNLFLTDAQAQLAEDRAKAVRESTRHIWEPDNVPLSWMTPDTFATHAHSGPVDFTANASTFARLRNIKTRVDPTDVFHTSMTIPPSSAASAVGDPHMQNIYGERFDLMQPGRHTLLEIPRHPEESTLLRVEAEAQHDGSACADVYFKEVNITGEWADAKEKGGLRFHALDVHSTESKWMTFEKVDLKVTHGHTKQGILYLNFYVRRLAQAGYAIGGILGADDYTEAATPVSSCQRSVSLVEGLSGRAEQSASSASSAEASLM